MIKIFIHSSIDRDILGEHYFQFNKITLSSKEHAQLVVDDSSLTYFGIIMQLSEDGVLVNTLPVNQFYLSNSKKIAGTKLHHRGDKIQFGSTVIEIIDFKISEHLGDLSLAERMKNAFTDPEKKKLLELLEEELIHLENSRNA